MKQIIVEIPEENLAAMIKLALKLPVDAKIVSWWGDCDLFEDMPGLLINRRLRVRIEHDSLPELKPGCMLPIINLSPAEKVKRQEFAILRKAIA